ncbi:tetratricopeptide repeat protein [Flavobacterium pectinovorum]|uniref:tetratricopeptide repeat protein n=1 Tax=Flavobacterium pectinovorum TaxID=29533 RepID=UPI001FADE420|nr:hypothetical protein [Flavobacterium pectinovorum]MCI9845330.1 hypothetical protein [Flavobacterium pectinovorum]
MEYAQKKAVTLLLFLFALFFSQSYSQTIVVPAQDLRQDFERTLHQEIPSQDTLSVKNFLKPLQQSRSEKVQVLYYGLLANGYADFFDEMNAKSDENYLLSIQKAKKSKDEALVVWSQFNYCKYLYYYRKMDKLIPVLLETIDNANKINPEQMILPGETYKIFGWIMMRVDDHELALEFLKKALHYTPKDSSDYGAILNAIGNCYLNKGNTQKANSYFDKTATAALRINDQIRYAKALGDKALIAEKTGDLNAAITLLEKDIALSIEYGNEKNNMYASILMARILLKQKKITAASTYLQKAEDIAITKLYYRDSLKEIIELKLKISNGKDPEKELILHRQLKVLENWLLMTDGDFALRKSNWIVQKTKYENEVKSTQVKLVRESKINKIYVIIILLAIMLIFLIVIFSKKRLKNISLEYDKKTMYYEIEKLRYEKTISEANQDLNTQIQYLHNKNSQISKLKLELEAIHQSPSSFLEEKNGKLQALLDSHLMTEENWSSFKREFQKEYVDFTQVLAVEFPELKESNLKIIMLQKLRFNNPEIASLLGITVEAVKKSKQRLKKKMGNRYNLLFEFIEGV